jgi:hypothetical protein
MPSTSHAVRWVVVAVIVIVAALSQGATEVLGIAASVATVAGYKANSDRVPPSLR